MTTSEKPSRPGVRVTNEEYKTVYVIKITFKNGLVGNLTHDNPQQIRRWLDLFSTDQAREKCNIADIVVYRNAKTICYSEVA